MKKTLTFIAFLTLMAMAAAFYVFIVQPAQRNFEAEKEFASDIRSYVFTDIKKFRSNTEEIKQYMDDDIFMSLERDLSLIQEIKASSSAPCASNENKTAQNACE